MIGEIDKDSITKGTLVKLRAITTQEDFDVKKMRSVSAAAVGLFTWIKAIEAYAMTYLTIPDETKNFKQSTLISPGKSKLPQTAKISNPKTSPEKRTKADMVVKNNGED